MMHFRLRHELDLETYIEPSIVALSDGSVRMFNRAASHVLTPTTLSSSLFELCTSRVEALQAYLLSCSGSRQPLIERVSFDGPGGAADYRCFGNVLVPRRGNRPAMLGIAAGAMFALSAVGFRGAVLALDTPSFVMAATFTLALGLALQAAVLTLYLAVRDRTVLVNILRNWQPSLAAGFLGALASQFWYLAFAVATAASVRTLALVEVLFAQAIATFAFRQKTTPREAWMLTAMTGLRMALIKIRGISPVATMPRAVMKASSS